MSIQVWRKPPAFPAQWLYGLYAFAPVTGFLATVICEDFRLRENLTPAPGRQAHTTSPYALATLVSRSLRVHRIPPHGRDDRDRPSSCRETGGVRLLICPTAPAKYFCARGWTDFGDLPVVLFCRRATNDFFVASASEAVHGAA